MRSSTEVDALSLGEVIYVGVLEWGPVAGLPPTVFLSPTADDVRRQAAELLTSDAGLDPEVDEKVEWAGPGYPDPDLDKPASVLAWLQALDRQLSNRPDDTPVFTHYVSTRGAKDEDAPWHFGHTTRPLPLDKAKNPNRGRPHVDRHSCRKWQGLIRIPPLRPGH